MTVKALYYGFLLTILMAIFPFVGVILALLLMLAAPALLVEYVKQPRPTKWYKPHEYAAAVAAGLLLAWAGYACIVNS